MTIELATPVGQIATQHPLATRVFARHGIDFCCGGSQPIEKACMNSGADPSAVIQELEKEIQGNPKSEQRWDEAPLEALVQHILTTYHEPLKEELPRIEAMMRKVHQVHGSKDQERFDALLDLVLRVKMDIDNHLPKEEQVLFPAILNGQRHMLGGPITVMEAEHEDLGGMLRKMRELTNDYTTPEGACNTWTALWAALDNLESELHEHIHLENNILHKRAFNG